MREEVMSEMAYCVQCEHLEDNEDITFICEAYPLGIPDDIVLGYRRHDEVLPDQTGKAVFKKLLFFR
jgi:hypothetical protein